MDGLEERPGSVTSEQQQGAGGRKKKKVVAKRKQQESAGTTAKDATAAIAKKPRKSGNNNANRMTAVQQSVADQLRRAFEDDLYSASGSIVHDHAAAGCTEHDDDDDQHGNMLYRGKNLRLDRAGLQQVVRKFFLQQQKTTGESGVAAGGDTMDDDDDDGTLAEDATAAVAANKKTAKTKSNTSGNNSKRKEDSRSVTVRPGDVKQREIAAADLLGLDDDADAADRDGSIFGQTTGTSNSTWVECDKCKKWRRLRGVIDEKKLPSRWFCTMNKTDPERARCSAPEEEYETTHTPESAADARSRRHLRIWVRRLQCNEAYEARQPTQTRGKKRQVSSSKEPYEWVRCCNPSCGKWRATLRIMDAKSSVLDRTKNGEWYCVMNVWDEKTASCAAPQENLPAVGCPPWVMQD